MSKANNTVLQIGTRESALATWQAQLVSDALSAAACNNELVFIKSEGDVDLVTPLYEMGVQGIFTKTLDAALLNNRIDLAVHSYKDVPVQLAEGLVVAAVLKRGNPFDILVSRDEDDTAAEAKKLIATSSARRKAQWLHRYPGTVIENLRGNVNTRLQKLKASNWHGAIFAAAGLERLGIDVGNSIQLDWMLPAPAQGAIVVVCRAGDEPVLEACRPLNDSNTAICTGIEKQFLKALGGGCSVPVGAYAYINNDSVVFKGNVFTIDGVQELEVNLVLPVSQSEQLGHTAAQQLLQNGGDAIIKTFKQ